MAVSITCPPAAQMHLRTVLLTYPPHGLSALVSAFLHAEKLTERKIREVAAFRGVTLTMVVRALMVKRYPELKPLWPAPKHTSAQIDGIKRRTLSPVEVRSDSQVAAAIMQRLLDNPDDGRAKRRARDYINKHLE
jgi:hypothetical protein